MAKDPPLYSRLTRFSPLYPDDFLDTAVSNSAGAFCAVVTACLVAYVVDVLGWYYNARLLQRHKHKYSIFGECMYSLTATCVRINNWTGIGRESSFFFLQMEDRLKQHTRELRDPDHPRTQIVLTPEEEVMLIEAIVEAEGVNIWSLLMPAVYQLVPGSLIARLWYNAVFPPPSIPNESEIDIDGKQYTYIDVAANPEADDVFYGMMVISTSLALGLLLGFGAVKFFLRVLEVVLAPFTKDKDEDDESEEARIKRMRFLQQGIMSTPVQDDPAGSVRLRSDGSHPGDPILGADRVNQLGTMQEDAMEEKEPEANVDLGNY